MKKSLVSSLLALPLLGMALGLAALMTSPYTGLRLDQRDDRWVLASVTPGTASQALAPHVGQAVVALAGLEPGRFDLVEDSDYILDAANLRRFVAFQTTLADRIVPGREFSMVFSTPDGPQSVTLMAQGFSFWQALERLWVLWAIAGLSLALATVTLLRRPGDVRATVFFALMVAVAVFAAGYDAYTARETAFPAWALALFRGANTVAIPVLFVLLLVFCVVFPTPRPAWNRWYLWVLAVVPMVVASVLSELRLVPEMRMQTIAVYRTVGALVLVASWVKTRSNIERHQILWVFLGLSVSTLPYFVTLFFPVLLFQSMHYSDRLLLLLFPAFPLSIVLAITRYRLMDLDRVFDSLLVQVPVLALLAGLDYGLVQTLNWVGGARAAFDPAVQVLSLWAALLAYVPLRNLVQGTLERVFWGHRPGSESVLQGFGTLLVTMSLDRLEADSLKFFVTTFGSRGGVWASSRGVLASEWDEPRPGPEFAAVAAGLAEAQPVYQLEDRLGVTPSALLPGLLVPLTGGRGPLGYLLLGAKSGRRLYSRQEIRLATALAQMAAVTLEKLQQEDASRREKERLSREIHDGVGGSFSNALMTLNLILKGAVPEEHRSAQLVDLRTMMTENLSEIRDLIWGIEERESTLGDLVAHLQDKVRRFFGPTGIACRIDVTVDSPQAPLTSAFRIHVVRIVQEVLTNTLAHAQTPVFELKLWQEGQRLFLTFRDEGRGFDPALSAPGYGLRNLQARAVDLGATLTLESAPGQGTTTRLALELS